MIIGEKSEKESKERDILIEGAITGLGEDLVLGKFLGIHRMIPAKNLNNTRESALTGFRCSQINDYLICHHRTVTDGSRYRDPQLSTGLSSLSPVVEREEQ